MNTKIGLLPRIIIAIVLGILLGGFTPGFIIRVFITFNGIFGNFLGFCIPLIILGLVAPGIADLGKNAGRLLLITVILAYCSTLFSGFFTYFSCSAVFPSLINGNSDLFQARGVDQDILFPFFQIDMPPVFGIMTALILAFTLGIGVSSGKGNALKSILTEFKSIIERLISSIIIPLLPIYIFGIFLNMRHSGTAFQIISVFGKIIIVIFILHILLLLIQFAAAGIYIKRNPFRLLINMLPAYMTALGTSSSAATIPVTLAQTKKNGVREDIADFCIPLCATIHLSGSTMKITAMSLAFCIMLNLPHDAGVFTGFIFMLGVIMVAAPGVPSGAIIAAAGIIQSMLHLDSTAMGVMIALYAAIDSFGTACNVTGDCAIALVVNKIEKKRELTEITQNNS